MKIIHLCLEAPYNDYWGYQDNLLPKYHRKLGHEVTVITTNRKHDGGKIVETNTGDYYLKDGQRIIRLAPIKYKPEKISKVYKLFNIYNLLCDIRPEFIMVHGLSNFSVLQAVKYKKRINPSCRIIADNHLDYNNAKWKFSFKSNLYRYTLRLLNMYMQKQYDKVYGVTPWREEYAQEFFGIQASKTGVLVMGADDEKIQFEQREQIRSKVRNNYSILDNEFLLVTGGKIDKKKNVETLIESIKNIPRVKLLIFGTIGNDMKDEMKKYQDNEKIIFTGWIPSEEVYNYFLAADMVAFLGGHSVLWEQACACKVPCIFKYWHKMDHFDLGGNCYFVYNNDSKEIGNLIESIINDSEKYQRMLKVANSDKAEKFFYSRIARESLEV